MLMVRSRPILMCTCIAAILLATVSCDRLGTARREKPSDQTAQRTFASPEDAGAALLEAAKSSDRAALLSIFGPDGEQVVFTGDSVRDQDNIKGFVDSYGKMHRWVAIRANGEVLNVGPDNYVFPIPLGRNSAGQWYFDTAAGKDEILARRIGRGELTAIAAAAASADAQHEYFNQAHDGVKQYAQQFVSDPGKQNGLYWAVADGQRPSPLGGLGDFAKTLGYTGSGAKPQPFNGYYYRILTKQNAKAAGGAKDYLANGKMTGGFAILAYPADYRNSGIMTFLVGTDGVVYQKDLGENTSDRAAAITEYDPSDGWQLTVSDLKKTG